MGSIARLLIANRGEIAVRIARAARAEGITPLGIYAQADRDARFLSVMQESALIGPAPASESYLHIERILAAARALRADAIHPGYGFLSERPAFAQAAADAGYVFVGPPPSAMRAAGDKGEAKRLARACGIPVIPGYDGEDQSPLLLRAQATIMDTPLLIKAAAGGGGRGMRIVHDLSAFDQALEEAKREALAGFGDDRVLLERYLPRPRHIEFQILADAHGATIHLGERDCSIQRRRQKIVEEAPAHAMGAALRARMGDAAVRIAREAGYVNAGTVEFLLDGDAFYFLEMNARLQVEHPVTEEAYGVDLVREQLRIASGKPLTLIQADVIPRAWAFEARINAEEPTYEALPATGTISEWHVPEGPGVRVDSGVDVGSEVSVHYDSLLAKLIVSGPNRAAALEKLITALETSYVSGVATNIPALLAIARAPDFRSGAPATTFLEEHKHIFLANAADEIRFSFLAALGALVTDDRVWRIGSVGIPVSLRCGDTAFAVIASRARADATWSITGDAAGVFRVQRNGEYVAVNGEHIETSGRVHLAPDGIDVFRDGTHVRFTFERPEHTTRVRALSDASEQSRIVSPMPGKITRVVVQAGDAVREQDLLLILEAMKMEHRIEAPRTGTIQTVHVLAGALVAKGAMLVDLS